MKTLLIVFIIIAFLIILVIWPAFGLVRAFGDTLKHAQTTSQAVGSFDLEKFSQSLPPLKESLKKTQKSIFYLSWVSFLPWVGGFVSDFKHLSQASSSLVDGAELTVSSLAPHAKKLGLTGEQGAKITAQDRIKVLVEALREISPDLDRIAPKISEAKGKMDKVDPDRYPDFWFFAKIRRNLQNAKDLTAQTEFFLVEARPLLLVMPNILGIDAEKNYLVLFQNDKEIRPSGGFLTAYTFVKFQKGSLSASGSDDIYHLDERLHNVCLRKICPLSPPAPIIKYLPEPTGKPKTAWDSRDSNLSPDWKVSAQEFERFYNIIGGPPFDGIIVVDTYFVKNLLTVTGPISVGGYQTKFSSENVVEELLNYTEIVFAGRAQRKQVLGDLMYSILLTVMQSGKDKFAPLIKTLLTSANEKHIMFYFKDARAQEAFERFNWAGRVRSFDGDYLLIVDSNFAGGKANLYIEEKVEQRVEISSDGTLTKEVKIEYKNPAKYNNRRNPGYRDWVRIYLPQGAKLIEGEGSQDGIRESEELGKIVLDGFLIVRPEGSAKLRVKYKLPQKVKKGDYYKLLIQKQPGTDGFFYSLFINGKEVEKPNPLKTDKEVKIKI
jgi:hypothetical protein